MDIIQRSFDFIKSPTGFKVELAGSVSGYLGSVVLGVADVEPSWLEYAPLAVAGFSYTCLAVNVLHKSLTEDPNVNAVEVPPGQQG